MVETSVPGYFWLGTRMFCDRTRVNLGVPDSL